LWLSKGIKEFKALFKRNNVAAVVVTSKPTGRNPFFGGRPEGGFPP
jgi:hypothetical protein